MPSPSLTHTLEGKACLKTILKNIFEKPAQLPSVLAISPPCFVLICLYHVTGHTPHARRLRDLQERCWGLLCYLQRDGKESPCSPRAWPRRPAATWALLTSAKRNKIFMPWLWLHCDKPFSNTYITVNYSTRPYKWFSMSTVTNGSLIWCNISSNLNIYYAVCIFHVWACSRDSLSCLFSWSTIFGDKQHPWQNRYNAPSTKRHMPSTKLSSCPAMGAMGCPDWVQVTHTAAPSSVFCCKTTGNRDSCSGQMKDSQCYFTTARAILHFGARRFFASRLKVLPKSNSLHWKDALWAQGSTQTASEYRIPFWKISLQFAITNAGKHSITVSTAHNNILWS